MGDRELEMDRLEGNGGRLMVFGVYDDITLISISTNCHAHSIDHFAS